MLTEIQAARPLHCPKFDFSKTALIQGREAYRVGAAQKGRDRRRVAKHRYGVPSRTDG